MKIGNSVRAALDVGERHLRISTHPTSHSGIIIKPTRAQTSSPAAAELIRNLQDQGLTSVSLSQALKICDAFMQGKS